MTLIRVKGEATNDEMISLEHLHRLVLKSIFDEQHMRKSDWHLLEDAFEKWNDYLTGQIIQSAIGEEQKIQLGLYALQCRMNTEGKYDKRKETFKRHGVDYLKFYKMNPPSEEDKLRAEAILQEWNRKDGREFSIN